jgi:two-component SAPR family response regulator
LIVDDEQLALDSMTKMVGELETFVRLQPFLYPLEAIRAAKLEPFDIAFLDIEMVELSGLETAKRLLALQPDMAIVFVTAYRDYAVEAFEMDVLDYVVKPVQRARLASTLARIRSYVAAKAEREDADASQGAGNRPQALAFRRLELIAAGNESSASSAGWRTMRAQELFAYFLYRRGAVVPKDYLLELFWTDHDPDKSLPNLYATISIIRRQLKTISGLAKLDNVEDGYRFELGDITYDVEEWERKLPVNGVWFPEQIDEALQWLEMYRGDFLEEHPYEWADQERYRLRLIFFQHAQRLADLLVEQRRYREAFLLYESMKQRFPLVEYGYLEKMKLGAVLGDHELVTREFSLLRERLHEELNEHPSLEAVLWFEEWKRRGGRA